MVVFCSCSDCRNRVSKIAYLFCNMTNECFAILVSAPDFIEEGPLLHCTHCTKEIEKSLICSKDFQLFTFLVKCIMTFLWGVFFLQIFFSNAETFKCCIFYHAVWTRDSCKSRTWKGVFISVAKNILNKIVKRNSIIETGFRKKHLFSNSLFC